MDMEVLYLLAPIRANVRKHPVAGLANAELLGRADYELEKGMTLAGLPAIQIVERSDVLARHHQHVLSSLWVDVAKSNEGIILRDNLAGNGPTGNPTEYAVFHGV